MKRLVTGRFGYRGSVLVPKRLTPSHVGVASYQHGGLKDQDRWHNLRWMQEARP
ncbi:MAG: hypothetical protein RJA87_797 [Pseudomonadota bacterium]|jgi:hypothetical protein